MRNLNWMVSMACSERFKGAWSDAGDQLLRTLRHHLFSGFRTALSPFSPCFVLRINLEGVDKPWLSMDLPLQHLQYQQLSLCNRLS